MRNDFLYPYLGKYIRIEYTRGIGSHRRKKVREGVLTEIQGNHVCLLNKYDRCVWVDRPVPHRDEIKRIPKPEIKRSR